MTEQLRAGRIDGMDEADREVGRAMMADLVELHMLALHADAREVFEEAMLRSGYPSLGDRPNALDRAQFAANMSRLYEILDEYCRYQKNALLVDALHYLRLVRETGEEREASIDQDVDAVRISTIHSAKGLEWDHVIVAAASQGKLPRRDRKDSFALPPDLVEGVIDVPESHKEEQRRLFYVGLTRARNSLTVTWSRRYMNDFRDAKRTEFLQEIPQQLYVASSAPQSGFVAAPRRRLPDLSKDGKIVLSYSAIDDFRDCPRRFEYRTLWRMPPIFSPQAWFGDLLHRVLFRLGQLRIGNDVVNEAVVESMWTAEWDASTNRGRVASLKDEGLSLIRDYVASPLWTDPVFAAVEHGFRIPIEHKWNWILTGKIDRIDMGSDGIPTVVDYKSGSPGDQDDVRSSLQLKIYAKVAMEHYKVQEVRAELHWLQTAEAATVTWTSEDLEKLDYRLFRTYEEVEACQLNGHYPPRPSAYRCTRCAFQLICPEKVEN